MSKPDNTARFDGLADIYASHRPTYPPSVMAALGARAMASSAPHVAIDVGAGTGISTASLAEALPDWRIIACEPNGDMRAKAVAGLSGRDAIEFSDHGAELLPGDDGGTGLVMAAQALHWFDGPRFFSEAARVLAPGGMIAILYNNRQNAVSVALSKIEDYLEDIGDGYNRDYRARDIPAMLRGLDEFEQVERVREVWLKPSSVDDLVDYFMSRSMMQPLAKKVGMSKLRHRIGDIADEHARAGMVDIPFATELDMATRK